MGKKQKRRKRRHPQPPTPRAQVVLDEILNEATSLAQEGDVEKALEVLENIPSHLQRRFEVLLLRGMLLTELDELLKATETFEAALRTAPNHPIVLGHLALLYAAQGWPAHAARTARRALEVEEGFLPAEAVQDLREVLEEVTAEIRKEAAQWSVPFDKMEEALHTGERAERQLIAERFEEAARLYVRASRIAPSWPVPYNYAAIAYFFTGQVKRAIRLSETVLEAHPDNVDALANLARFHLALGEREKAEQYAARLKQVRIDSLGDLETVIETLGFLDDDKTLYEIYRRHRRRIDDLSPYALFTLGSAAANLRHFRVARRLWQKAEDYGYPSPALLPYFIALDKKAPGPGRAERYFTVSLPQLTPLSRIDELANLMTAWKEGEITEKSKEKRLRDMIKRTPFLVRGLIQILWESLDPLPGIEALAFVRTPEAIEELRRFAFGKSGRFEDRLAALQHLIEIGEIEPDQPVQIWDEEAQEWGEARLFPVEITSEIETPEHDPEVIEHIDAAVEALQRGDLEEARKECLAALELDPQSAVAHHNLAVTLQHMDETEEAVEHLKRALEIRPDYLFARCSLAHFYIDRGDLEKADELLTPIAERRRFHPAEWTYYHRTMARLRLAQEDFESAQHHAQLVLEVIPDDEAAQRMLDTARLRGFFSGPFWEKFLRRQREREEKKRHRPTRPDATLAECLDRITKDGLIGTARAMPTPRKYNVRKSVLIQDLVEYITNPEALREIVKGLSDAERQALQDVLEAGGTMAWEDFTRRYGDDLDESPFWNYHEPETVMGRLRMLGLLSEGTVGDHLIVLVPYELRGLLPPLLEEAGGSGDKKQDTEDKE